MRMIYLALSVLASCGGRTIATQSENGTSSVGSGNSGSSSSGRPEADGGGSVRAQSACEALMQCCTSIGMPLGCTETAAYGTEANCTAECTSLEQEDAGCTAHLCAAS